MSLAPSFFPLALRANMNNFGLSIFHFLCYLCHLLLSRLAHSRSPAVLVKIVKLANPLGLGLVEELLLLGARQNAHLKCFGQFRANCRALARVARIAWRMNV